MRVSLSEAKAQLTELVRRAQGGEEVVLTRHGQPVVTITPIKTLPDKARRREILEELRRAGAKASPGETAERSQDFLYDEFGLPK